jgi:predicted RNase H-like HicB family nuclease
MLRIKVDRENDNRWIGEVVELAGVLTYGDSRDEAIKRAQALALRVLADQIEQGERFAVIDRLFVIQA